MAKSRMSLRNSNMDTAYSQIHHIAYVGTVVSESICESSPACSIAGNLFQLNLLRNLSGISPESVTVFSVYPIPMYPNTRQILVRSRVPIVLADGLTAEPIPFVNLPILKQLSVALMIFFRLIIWLWQTRSEARSVMVYNVFSPFSVPVLAATSLMRVHCIAVIADLPHGGYHFMGAWGILERLDFWIQIYSMRLFDGLVVLTRHIVTDFAPRSRFIVIEGGVDSASDINGVDYGGPIDQACLYSGALNELNGVDVLLKAFSLITDPNWKLWVFGDGPLKDMVWDAAQADARITYYGLLPNSLVREYQRRAFTLVNPRPRHQLIARYTFPSKLLEYMLSGRPVISSQLPGIPEEYHDFVCWLNQETPEDLARLIQYIGKCRPSDLADLGQRARQFVLHKKNWNEQSRSIYEFIRTL